MIKRKKKKMMINSVKDETARNEGATSGRRGYLQIPVKPIPRIRVITNAVVTLTCGSSSPSYAEVLGQANISLE